MPGIESAPQRAVSVPMEPLVTPASEIVTPSAVAALSDAFRQGIITSEDILQRHGELARTKQKAELQTLREQMSPEMVAARQAQIQLAGRTAQAGLGLIEPRAAAERAQMQLAGQTAQAGLELVEPRAAAERTELERKAAEAKYGSGIQLFQTLSPEAGIVDIPKSPDGRTDYAKMAEMGLQLAAQKVRKQRAVERLQNIEYREGTEASGAKVLFKLNKFGEPVTPELETQLRADAERPLKIEDIQPGTAQVLTKAAPSVVSTPSVVSEPETEETYRMRAQLINRGLISNDEANTLPASSIRQKFEGAKPLPPPAEPGARQIGEIVSGKGMIISEAGADKKTTPAQIEQQLVALDSVGKDIAKARQLISGQNVVGPAIGSGFVRTLTSVGAAVGIESEEKRRAAQRELEILRSQKVLEGAQLMKGNLSDKDVRFLQDTIPQLSDDESIWENYLNKWELMNEANKRILRGELPKNYSVLDSLNSQTGVTPPPSVSIINRPASKIANILGIGRVRRRPDGAYERVP